MKYKPKVNMLDRIAIETGGQMEGWMEGWTDGRMDG
jgi:hypothetical protein